MKIHLYFPMNARDVVHLRERAVMNDSSFMTAFQCREPCFSLCGLFY